LRLHRLFYIERFFRADEKIARLFNGAITQSKYFLRVFLAHTRHTLQRRIVGETDFVLSVSISLDLDAHSLL